MSERMKRQPPVRRVARRADPEFEEDYVEDEEDINSESATQPEESYAPEKYSPQRAPQRKQTHKPRNAPPERYEPYGRDRGYRDVRAGRGRGRLTNARRDPFPMIMGAVVGAAVVGLMAIVFLLTRPGGGTTSVNPPSSSSSNPPATSGSTNPGSTGANNQSTSAGGEPPRMPLEDFKKLYDDPEKRPLIIDVRAKDVYDQGHIKGAISFPEADVDTRVGELPKDKLVVAYCQ